MPVPGKAPFLERTTIPWAREMYPFIRFLGREELVGEKQNPRRKELPCI